MTARALDAVVHRPETPHAVRGVLADACTSGTALRLVGGDTWKTAGRPVRAQTALSLRGLRGVIEYVPGDLVLTVGAGTTLQDIADITGAEDQWLALDPYVSVEGLREATIGATIATASSGPLALGYGRVRDLVLGLTVVSGDGTMVRAGGRVVKNVAGFDLVRLQTGAWGTLGAVTQVSLRLHARPATDRTVAIALDVSDTPEALHAALETLVTALNTAPLLAAASSLAACVCLTHDAAARIGHALGLGAPHLLLLARATGNATRVAAQLAALSALGTTHDVDGGVWQGVRTLAQGNASLRASDAPMRTANTVRAMAAWAVAQQATSLSCLADPLQGLVHASARVSETPRGDGTLPARAIADVLPTAWWAMQPMHHDDAVSRQVRAVCDPAGICNPGLLGPGRTPTAGVPA